MGRRPAFSFACALVGATLASSSCGPPELNVVTSEHVILHWDPSEHQLCGGTLEHLDNTLETIAGTYGVSLGSRPSITMFWLKSDIVQDMCLPMDAAACARPQLNGTTILFVYAPVDDHELTHAVRITGARRGMPSFFLEGAAVRWEPGVSSTNFGTGRTINLDAEVLRDLMVMRSIPSDAYTEAGFFWIWLEAKYGPEAMATFASKIWEGASLERIEDAFEDTFGVSIDQVVAESAGSPLLMFDTLPCMMPNIPTITWEGEPVVLSAGAANCQDTDIVSYGTNAVRFMRLELPEDEFSIRVEGPEDTSNLRLDPCTGGVRPFEDPLFIPTVLDDPRRGWFGGTYIATVTAAVQADGTIDFPRVVVSQP